MVVYQTESEYQQGRWRKKGLKLDLKNQQVSWENILEIGREKWRLNKNGQHGDNKYKR